MRALAVTLNGKSSGKYPDDAGRAEKAGGVPWPALARGAAGPLLSILVLAAACVILAQYGWKGRMHRDDAVYFYSGQQMVEGVPPYISIFDVKTPLSLMVATPGVGIAREFGFDEVFVVRLCFLIFSVAAVAAVFLLGRALGSTRLGLVAAAIFVAFPGFGIQAFSGSNPKTLALLFQIVALFFLTRHRWFLTGLTSSLAVLTWQPMIYVLITAVVVCFSVGRREDRRANLLRLSAGIVIPVLVTGTYFVVTGAFQDLIDGAVLLPTDYAARASRSLQERLTRPVEQIIQDYAPTHPAIFAGWLLLPAMLVSRLVGRRSVRAVLRDPAAGFFITAGFSALWALMDFQNYPDAYPLLPYAAIGLAWGVDSVLSLALPRGRIAAVAGVAITVVVAGVPAFWAANHYEDTANTKLVAARDWAALVKARWIREGRVATLENPVAMVLLRARNPNRYLVTYSPVNRWIAAEEPGGMKGWLRSIERFKPEILVVGNTRALQRPIIRRWLDRHFHMVFAGRWPVYVPKLGSA